MACCVFLAFVIACLLALRDGLARWRGVAILSLSVGFALLILTLGFRHHRHHLPEWASGPSAETRE